MNILRSIVRAAFEATHDPNSEYLAGLRAGTMMVTKAKYDAAIKERDRAYKAAERYDDAREEAGELFALLDSLSTVESCNAEDHASNIRERLAELEKLRDPAMWCAWARLGVDTDSAYVSEDDTERHWPKVFGVAFPAYRGPHGKESAESLAERVRTSIVSLLPDVVRAGWRPAK